MALGVVSIYRATGVPNFAQGAMAMIFSFVFFHSRDHLGTVLAAVLTLAVAAVGGALFYVGVMRQLRTSPLMARIAATIGLLLLLHGVAFVAFPVVTSNPASILPQNRVSIGDYSISVDRLIIAGVALVCAIALEYIGRRTRFGLATRAIADNEKGVILIGQSPGRLAAANWAIASVLAAIAGILLSPITGLDVDALTLLIVPVLAAALLARFTSFLWAVLAGFAIGMLQSLLQLYSVPGAWWEELWKGPGRVEALPALAVFVAILIMGKKIPQRDSIIRGRLPASPTPRNLKIGLPLVFAVYVALLYALPLNWVAALTVTISATIISASLVLLAGMGGQISLMQIGLAGLGAYVGAKTASEGVSFVPGLLLASLAGAAVGFVVGLPALRVRGQTLAIMTLAASLALYDFVFTDARLMGELGFLRFPGFPDIAGYQLGRRSFGVVCLVLMLAALLLVAVVRRSRFGHRLLLVRESERMAIISGVSVTQQKLAAFTMASALAAIGGALLAHSQLVFSYETFTPIQSLLLFCFAYISGIGMISGAVIAGFGAPGGMFSNLLAQFGAIRYHEVIGGGLLLIALQIHPDGLATVPEVVRERIRSRRARTELASGVSSFDRNPSETVGPRKPVDKVSTTEEVR